MVAKLKDLVDSRQVVMVPLVLGRVVVSVVVKEVNVVDTVVVVVVVVKQVVKREGISKTTYAIFCYQSLKTVNDHNRRCTI